MTMMYWAIIGLGAFVAIWMLFVAPAERRHHKRKLELLQNRIEKRQGQKDQSDDDAAADQDSDIKET